MTDPRLIDKTWRMSNLYKIRTKKAALVKFRMNRAQEDFNKNKHTRNIILKSRQLGFCLEPNTRVLTADLRWVPISKLQIGQEIVSVDEKPCRGRGSGRRMKVAVVEKVLKVFRDSYEISFDDGRKVICTSQHPWLSKSKTQSQPS